MGVNKSTWERILRCASETGVSDIHVTAGEPVYWRRSKVLSALKDHVPTEKDTFEMFQRMVSEDMWERMAVDRTVNCAFNLGEWRYRLHAYKKQGQLAFAIRTMPKTIPKLDVLGQAALVEKFSRYRQGLLLITGTTGSGKSTTTAAFLEGINCRESLHILTLEDPIEYIYSSGHGFISQLEKGLDFDDYGRAVENAMRERPDIIMVSEMRNRKTVQAVLNAAVSGHFVVATMHAGSVVEAVERLVSMYPAGQQDMARSLLAASLVGICTQQLLPGRDGMLHCAVECLQVDHGARNIIRNGKYEQLSNIMQSGSRAGMQTMDMALEALKRSNLLARDWEKMFRAG